MISDIVSLCQWMLLCVCSGHSHWTNCVKQQLSAATSTDADVELNKQQLCHTASTRIKQTRYSSLICDWRFWGVVRYVFELQRARLAAQTTSSLYVLNQALNTDMIIVSLFSLRNKIRTLSQIYLLLTHPTCFTGMLHRGVGLGPLDQSYTTTCPTSEHLKLTLRRKNLSSMYWSHCVVL